MIAALLWCLLGTASAQEAHDFACCERPAIDGGVDAWLDLHQALVQGRSHTEAMSELAKAADAKLPPTEKPVAGELHELAERLAKADLPAVHEELGEVSRRVVWLALRGEGGARRVTQARCAGLGTWLQADTRKVENPWGRSCGHFL